MLGFGEKVITAGRLSIELANEIARVAVGVPVWLVFWIWAQRLFDGPSEEERGSELRKFYLYAAVFIGALTAVANATGILAGLLRRVLALAPQGDVRVPLSVAIGMAMLWVYHAFVLREDGQRAGEAPRQAGLHRLYLYLISTVGLSALLVGLSGDASVILRALERSFGEGLRGEAAWFTSAIIAGLPVWIIPWRQSQAVAIAAGSAGADARRSVVRKIYLYFFLFLGTMTVLSSAVYIVYRILGMILGGEAPTLTQLGHALAFGLIAVGVWLYHGAALLGDGKLAKREQAGLLGALRVVVVDVGEGLFGRAVTDQLKRDFPDISLDPIVLAAGLAGKAGKGADEKETATRLREAGLIVGPWVIAAAGGVVNDKIAAAVVSSPARKLLIPIHAQGWDWAGVDRRDTNAIVMQTVHAVKQVLAGEEVRSHRPLGVGAIIAIVAGVVLLLILLGGPLISLFAD